MREAISQRLDDLIQAARRLQALVDGETELPALRLCRAAVDVDACAAMLADHAAKLAGKTEGSWPP